MENPRDQACELSLQPLPAEAMMFCNVCSTFNEEDAVFCEHCGGSLRHPQHPKRVMHWAWLQRVFSMFSTPLLQTLIDPSFPHRLSFKTIKLIYSLSLLFAGLLALLFVVIGFHLPDLLGRLLLWIGAPLIFFLIVFYSRLLLEVLLLSFPKADRTVDKERLPQPTDSIEWNV